MQGLIAMSLTDWMTTSTAYRAYQRATRRCVELFAPKATASAAAPRGMSFVEIEAAYGLSTATPPRTAPLVRTEHGDWSIRLPLPEVRYWRRWDGTTGTSTHHHLIADNTGTITRALGDASHLRGVRIVDIHTAARRWADAMPDLAEYYRSRIRSRGEFGHLIQQ